MTTTPRTQLTGWALQLAALGWHVFPLRPNGKKPALHGHDRCPGTGDCAAGHRGWEQRATTDPHRIRAAWSRDAFNIGIATGPSGLVVVDLDVPTDPATPDGPTALTRLAADRGATVPATYTVATPSGGRHLYYRTPAGVQLRNTHDALAPEIDTRAGGGYVVAAGSIMPNGAYELIDDADPVELPAWLVQALCESRSPANSEPPERAVANLNRYAATAVDQETQRVKTALSGQHNAVLSNAAYNLGQLVGADLLDHATATRELTAAAEQMPGLGIDGCRCTPRENTRVIAAGIAAGQRRPRRGTEGKDAA